MRDGNDKGKSREGVCSKMMIRLGFLSQLLKIHFSQERLNYEFCVIYMGQTLQKFCGHYLCFRVAPHGKVRMVLGIKYNPRNAAETI